MTPGLNLFVALALLLPQPPRLPPLGQPKMALDLVVKGPATSQPGDLVILDTSESQGVSARAWSVSPKSAEGRMLPVDGGEKLVFATSQPGPYRFLFAACTADGKTVRISPFDHVVGSVPPNPGPVPPGPTPPGPNPPVPPGPTPPTPDRYGLAAFVVSQAAAVSDSEKYANAQKFAVACDTVIAQIGAGALRTDSEIATAFKDQLSSVSLATKLRWRTALGALADKFDSLKITAPADWMQAFTEVSAGLRQVR
jgi:hypothetical protein